MPRDASEPAGAVQELPCTAAARTQEQLLSELLCAAPVGLVQMDEQGTVQLANPAAVALLRPLLRERALAHFFADLASVAPELQGLVEACGDALGPLLDDHRLEATGLNA